MEVENTDPGCCYNTDTSSFDVIGKEGNSTSRGITLENK